MTKHVHAELMMQYALDAAETDKPWERWEFTDDSSCWLSSLNTHPSWYPDFNYRRKPKFILINGIEVPEPMQEAPKLGTTYWVADTAANSLYSLQWDDCYTDCTYLQKGVCHRTEEAAKLHVTAMLSFTAK